MKYLIDSIESGKRNDENNNNEVFSLGGEHINWNGSLNLTNERYISNDFYNNLNKGKIKEKDILLVKDGATIGKTAFISNMPFKKMAVNEHVFIIRSNKIIHPKLLYYLIKSNLGFMQIKLTEKGSAQGGINLDFTLDVYFPVPENLTTQYNIVNYLDNRITKIDETIENNQKLIELLEEKKVALINQVVTKGLNPNVSMKDSGIEWIGEIPESWNDYKLKHIISQFIAGGTPKSDDEKFWGDANSNNIPWVAINDMSNIDKVKNTSKYITREGLHNKNLKILSKGTILYSIFASLGKVSVLGIPAVTNQAILGLITNSNIINNDYLVYYLNFLEKYIPLFSNSNTQDNLNTEIVKNFPIPLPNLNEQKLIVDFLDKETSNIFKAIDKIKKHTELLEEYKESLIYHVVTGQIDVRGEEI